MHGISWDLCLQGDAPVGYTPPGQARQGRGGGGIPHPWLRRGGLGGGLGVDLAHASPVYICLPLGVVLGEQGASCLVFTCRALGYFGIDELAVVFGRFAPLAPGAPPSEQAANLQLPRRSSQGAAEGAKTAPKAPWRDRPVGLRS